VRQGNGHLMNIEVVDDPAAAVADLLVGAAADGGDLVLTGGSSPERAYELAAAAGADWSGVTVWFSDERCVPPDDERSNFRMVDGALLSRLDAQPRVMRMQGELGPDAGAEAYAEALGDDPRFDLVLLGLGPDAHIASLFPGKPEKHVVDRFVVGVPEAAVEPFVPRISLTLPALNAGRHVVFLVTGESKQEAVRRAFGSPPDGESPAAHLRPAELTVFLDPAAAAGL
jgi:6-phosphogluconolactonase